PLLRPRHDQVDAPGVHRKVGDAEARYRVDDEDRVVLPGDRRVGADVVQYAGGGLAVLDEHGLRFGMALQRLGDTSGVDGLPERRPQVDRLEAVRAGEVEPAVAELAGADDDHAVAGRERVDDGRFHRPRARARERYHLGARLEELLERR